MTVYAVQDPKRPDGSSLFDLSPALEYGDLDFLLPPGSNVVLSSAPMVRTLRHKLRNYCDDDYLLAIGDPSAIAAAASIAAAHNMGRFRILKWDNRSRRYIEVAINIHGE